MRLYRVFDWDGRRQGQGGFGGPLFVHRTRQGTGRHDVPELFGAWYLSLSRVAAVAESLQYLRGHTIAGGDFLRTGGMRKALVAIDLAAEQDVIDLDDPHELARRHWRPSGIATLHRPTTQAIARTIFDAGAIGFRWWSVLEASWINVTLFHERAVSLVSIGEHPLPLTSTLGEVREAADRLGIQLH